MNKKAASIYCTCYSMEAIHTMVKLTDTSEHSGIFGRRRSLVVRGIVLLPNWRDVHMFSISGRNSESVNKGDPCVSSPSPCLCWHFSPAWIIISVISVSLPALRLLPVFLLHDGWSVPRGPNVRWPPCRWWRWWRRRLGLWIRRLR